MLTTVACTWGITSSSSSVLLAFSSSAAWTGCKRGFKASEHAMAFLEIHVLLYPDGANTTVDLVAYSMCSLLQPVNISQWFLMKIWTNAYISDPLMRVRPKANFVALSYASYAQFWSTWSAAPTSPMIRASIFSSFESWLNRVTIAVPW